MANQVNHIYIYTHIYIILYDINILYYIRSNHIILYYTILYYSILYYIIIIIYHNRLKSNPIWATLQTIPNLSDLLTGNDWDHSLSLSLSEVHENPTFFTSVCRNWCPRPNRIRAACERSAKPCSVASATKGAACVSSALAIARRWAAASPTCKLRGKVICRLPILYVIIQIWSQCL